MLRTFVVCSLVGGAATFRAGVRPASPTMAQQLSLRSPAACMGVPATVGDARDAFQVAYGRPVNGIYQNFVNEMLVGIQISIISPTYQPSRVFSLGFESLCTAFLAGMASDADRELLRKALCAGIGQDANKVQKDAEALTALAQGKTEAEFLETDDLKAIASTPNFKYSYPLGAGLLALMPLVGEEPSKEVIERWCEKLGLPATKMTKDWEFYEDSSRKLVEVRQMMIEMKAAGKRKEAQKLKDEAEKAAKEASEAEAAAKAETTDA